MNDCANLLVGDVLQVPQPKGWKLLNNFRMRSGLYRPSLGKLQRRHPGEAEKWIHRNWWACFWIRRCKSTEMTHRNVKATGTIYCFAFLLWYHPDGNDAGIGSWIDGTCKWGFHLSLSACPRCNSKQSPKEIYYKQELARVIYFLLGTIQENERNKRQCGRFPNCTFTVWDGTEFWDTDVCPRVTKLLRDVPLLSMKSWLRNAYKGWDAVFLTHSDTYWNGNDQLIFSKLCKGCVGTRKWTQLGMKD